MKKQRLTRLLFALAICGAIASQLPAKSGTVLAEDGYPSAIKSGDVLKTVLFTGVAQSGAAMMAGKEASFLGLGSTPIYDVYRNHGEQYSEVVKIIHAAELTTFYRESVSHTVLLPNNQALLAALGKDALEALQRPANKARAAAFLRARTLQGSYSFSRLMQLARAHGSVTTVDERTLSLRQEGDRLWIGKVEVLASEYPATNGFILETNPLLVFDDED